MPFVAEKMCDLLRKVLSFAVEKIPIIEDSASNEQKVLKKKIRQKIILRDKIIAVTKMRRFFNVIQEENDNIVKLKALSPSGRLPAGILRKGHTAIENAVSDFFQAQKADKKNEQLPGPSGSKIEKRKHEVGFRGRVQFKSRR